MALRPEHHGMVLRLKEIGEEIVTREMPAAEKQRDYWLKFHLPPHNSVDHLHLHVLAPASSISRWDVIVRFCDPELACDVQDVLQRTASHPPS